MRTYQTLEFKTAEHYNEFMNRGLKSVKNMTPSEKINLRTNISLFGSPDHSNTRLVLKGSAHYK